MSKGVKRSGRLAENEGSESSSCGFEGPMAAAVATVVRAPHEDFSVLRQEWAATRIQAMFRAFLVIVVSEFYSYPLIYQVHLAVKVVILI